MKSNLSESQAGAWARLSNPATGLASGAVKLDLKPLFLVAHQDDETIGGSAVLHRLPGSTVVYLTDGAPRDPGLRSADPSTSRQQYARTRWQEATEALALVDVPTERILGLGTVDQEAIDNIPVLVERFVNLLRRLRPEVVISHAYEGGHPDHDAAALIAYLAIARLRRDGNLQPELVEMSLYHARNCQFVGGEFLPRSSVEPSPELVLHLSPEELARKEQMMRCHSSQKLVLQGFPLDPERLRRAPHYDFTRPPHAGKLWYECLGWPMTGARWSQLAAAALGGLNKTLCS